MIDPDDGAFPIFGRSIEIEANRIIVSGVGTRKLSVTALKQRVGQDAIPENGAAEFVIEGLPGVGEQYKRLEFKRRKDIAGNQRPVGRRQAAPEFFFKRFNPVDISEFLDRPAVVESEFRS